MSGHADNGIDLGSVDWELSTTGSMTSSERATCANCSADVGVAFGEQDSSLHGILYAIRMCFLPIVLLGTVTNGFNFVILTRRDMRFLSTSVYLFALALADLGVMYVELFRVWFEWADLVRPETYFTGAYCKIANYTNGVVRDYSNWLIACLTLERVMMVASPYRAKHLCTVSTARRVAAVLFGTLCIPHLHSLIFSVPQTQNGGWVCWEDRSLRVGVIWAAIVEFAIGYVVILVVFVLNIILVSLIYRSKLSCLTCSSDKRANANRRLTRTLLLVAVVFLVCETPRIIISFVCRFLTRTPTRRIVLNLSYVLSGINHASNFFIYVLASPRFRHLSLATFPVSLIAKYVRKSQPAFTYRVQQYPDVGRQLIDHIGVNVLPLRVPEASTCLERISPEAEQEGRRLAEYQLPFS
ncbi:hypothetical protein LSH36_128g03018 [Paralvinella palmiformis]|uniref:G-protein coupled receptors family 1 profile domain-containing protein n=1 Tax=Paralvinella palmiformis TaxID=53620 RepID=A0AAD9JY71_9ANNE|nr:hypothetical protein LSH36_128g03018 [Paralvinella palmiformis]